MKKKFALVVFGVSLIGGAILLGLPWWAYGFGIVPALIGLAWLGVYNAEADASGGRGEMGQGS
ncbi:hypothetical protein [uncultured Tateyamaria sp.]|uniref:hypothetical protein n=1 Tax=uncultured Tateyamaria sp. TaxID=455651 RepID=UPI00263449E2|nr:hypothetical protein [uncultured Tateyamaria sp.]